MNRPDDASIVRAVEAANRLRLRPILEKAMEYRLNTVLVGLPIVLAGALLGGEVTAETLNPAATSINALGLDLLGKGIASDANTLLSPYSIQSALAMTYAGADGGTRAEMAKVLHFGDDEAALHHSFAALQKALDNIETLSAEQVKNAVKYGGPTEPITVTVANRLFGQPRYEFRAPFLALVKDTYGAPLQPLDFAANPTQAIKDINAWVLQKTRNRIPDLIPPGGLNGDTRLVLVNAIYLKAPWAHEFNKDATKPEPFHVKGGDAVDVPTMLRRDHLSYAQHDGFRSICVPYSGGELQLLILLPDDPDGLSKMEAKLTPEKLVSFATAAPADVVLHMPKFKMQPPLFKLGRALQDLGMKTAFDAPKGSANFDRMAPRKPNDYLYISEVFHRTFIEVDEKGTEAAAATAVVMMAGSAFHPNPPPPIEVRVDRPFVFAIQHRASGVCLFLGRVTDPR
jgi:serpin B